VTDGPVETLAMQFAGASVKIVGPHWPKRTYIAAEILTVVDPSRLRVAIEDGGVVKVRFALDNGWARYELVERDHRPSEPLRYLLEFEEGEVVEVVSAPTEDNRGYL
jgi:hypothetical protein